MKVFRLNLSSIKIILIGTGCLLIIGVIVWKGIIFSGVPDPTGKKLDEAAAILSCGVLVFREGLEAILVLAAITASLTRKQERGYSNGVAAGAGLGMIATVTTWFVVIAILSKINLPELDLQAATELLAIIVLLVVMN